MPLSFCLVTTFYPPYHFGGDGICVYRLAQALARRGHRVDVLHSRDSLEELLALLEETAAGGRYRGVAHCFTGTEEQAARCRDLGLVLGFGGVLTYPRSRPMRALFKELPEEAFVAETDSPYLPPQDLRGRRNEPANVRLVAEKMARVRRADLEQIAGTSTRNAEELFRLPESL